jgi:hypothetical protein
MEQGISVRLSSHGTAERGVEFVKDGGRDQEGARGAILAIEDTLGQIVKDIAIVMRQLIDKERARCWGCEPLECGREQGHPRRPAIGAFHQRRQFRR